ncbi:molybdenum cofactor biosynthesis protein B [Virgibacillus natechei]|uniref:Molybdenum cofactor biosynthesis protein B n=1 Tax=Virgibacillus natechei TaxID=1216297 RepID=A0ABS4IGA3_9BACI|nr:molybdenum cofactor biosynthesis protein B [Virgibacillus natechei]
MVNDHQKSTPVNCAVVTVSDTRNKETDKSGKLIMELLTDSNHQVKMYEIVPDDEATIRQTVENAITNQAIEAVIVNGGTGISYRDVTIESIQQLFDKELPGFGELFRYLSYQFDIGTASMLTRAICGVANNRVIFSTPGSSGAVKLAMEKLILPELGHTVTEINKDLPNQRDERH